MQYIEDSQLVETNNVIITDHRVYIIDMNIKEYFGKHLVSGIRLTDEF